MALFKRSHHGPSWKRSGGVTAVRLSFCRILGVFGLVWVVIINIYLRQQRKDDNVVSDFEHASPNRLALAKQALEKRWQYRNYPQVTVVVMPSPVEGPGTRQDRIKAIMKTWGLRHKEKFEVIIGTADRVADGGSNLPPEMFLEFPPELDDDENMGRIQWVLDKLYHRRGSIEWVMLANDHTFTVPENLLCYLSTFHERSTESLYLGHRLLLDGVHFNSGGAGALFNHAAVAVLLDMWSKEDKACMPRDDWAKKNAGVVIAKCLQRAGVLAMDTRDEEGGERFHVYGPVRTVDGLVDKWFEDYHDYPTLKGPGCCAAQSISFHYVGPSEALILHDIITYPRKYRSITFEQQIASWPSDPLELGGYSYPPNNVSSQVFDFLVHKMQLCPVP